MSDITTSNTGTLVDLMQERIDDQVNQITVETRVALQLQGLRWQATNLGIGAQVVEHTLGSAEKDDNNDDESWPVRVGRVLDKYL